MKILKKTIPLWAVLLVVILSASAVVAAIVATRQVSFTMRILAHNDIELYEHDHATILTSIALGDFYRKDVKSFPSNAPSSYYYIDNIGEADVWVSWSKQGTYPTGVTVTMMVDWGAGFQSVTEGTVIVQPIYAPPQANSNFKWYLTITATETAQIGTFTPKIVWNAQDVAP